MKIHFLKLGLKNPLISIALFFVCCCTTGCLNIVEEIWLNKDQSGRYTYTLDMSEMLKTTENMAKSMGGNIQSNDSDTEMHQDTTILLSALPDSIKQQFPNPLLFDRLQVRFLRDMPSKTILVTYSLDFKQLSEITALWTLMPKLKTVQPKGFSQGPGKTQASLLGIPPVYTFQNDSFIRSHIVMNQEEKALVADRIKQADNPVFKPMFENARYKIVVHLPKPVKTLEGEGVSSNGNTVDLSVPFLDLAKNVEKLSFQAKIE